MRFVAIEFDSGINNIHEKRYLRVPVEFNPRWHLGFIQYIKDKYNVSGDIKIYPLNIHKTSDDMGKDYPGFKNIEDDFNLALRSNRYYPPCKDTDSIRRQWAKLDPMSSDFIMKER